MGFRVVVLVFLFQWLLPQMAQAVTVYVDIEGTQKSGTDSVDISGDYTNGCMTYNIAANSTGSAARVEATEGDPETLWLRNVKITATSDCVDNGHIYFWAVFAAPPNTATNPNVSVNIARTASGVFAPATIGNWITATGWAQHDPVDPNPPDGSTGTWEEINQSDSHVVTCSTCGSFNKSRQRTWDPAQGHTFTSSHVLKGEIWFKLENNSNKLVFDNTASKGVKLQSKSVAEGPPPAH
jgi:hypothetical protein